MTLDELAIAAPFAAPLAVPAWTLGCFHRRSITFATGAEDTTTRVIWLQSHGLTGDLRIPADRPDTRHRTSLADCTREELVALAESEAGIADTGFDAGRMRWHNWAAFQPYDKFPEPGDLRRVGNGLLEFAPSGIYVEDWRAQGEADGLFVGLRLVSETGSDGIDRPRDGGLIVTGRHALFVLGRRAPLASAAPVQQQIAQADDPNAIAALAFDCEGSYLRRDPADGVWRVELSSNPFREGQTLAIEAGFAPGPEPGLLAQDVVEDGRPIRRLWKIDTLLSGQSQPLSTAATAESLAWLTCEASTLLRNAAIAGR